LVPHPDYIESGKREGARLLRGGERDLFMKLAIFSEVGTSMRIANSIIYGLASARWTADLKRPHRVAARHPGGHRLGER